MKGVAILVGLWRDRWSADASTVFDEQKTSVDFVSGRNSAIACFFVVVVVFSACPAMLSVCGWRVRVEHGAQ